MRRFARVWIPLLVALVAGGAATACVAALPPPHVRRAPVELEVDVVFYEALAPYGDWVWIASWGWVWSPRGVGPGWRPYTHGHWVETSDGWTWVSSWEWGWAPFHYGRWVWDGRSGWVWLPGSVWAPAWVAWRVGDGWIGWAPLPPEVRWRAGYGFDPWPWTIEPRWWSFVPRERLGDAHLRLHVVPGDRDPALLRDTRDVTRYEGDDRRAVERGLPDGAAGGEPRRAVPRAPIDEVDEPSAATRQPAAEGERVRVYRPEVRRAPDRPAERPSAPARRTRPPRRPPGV